MVSKGSHAIIHFGVPGWDSRGGAMQLTTYVNEPIPVYAAGGFLPLREEWFAVHTRSKCEKKVATQLGEMQIKCFLPVIREVRSWSDRRKVIDQPLFPGYVFVRIPGEDRVRVSVLRTNGVVAFVGVQGQGIAIPDPEIDNIQTLLSSRVSFEPYPFLRVGQKVRIRGGYLDGIEGILAAKNSDRSVVISIDLIQRSLAVRVSGFDLEPIR
ncbi:MAG: UpxY family transcription antiterminator [Acidobacteria bacterium]|nr:MAG: UpxY family transcription antiterminator [Acidobacteriota bacterium]